MRDVLYEFSLNPQLQWPLEQDLWILANASGGLFVYADTVIKYVGDRTFGNPTSQLNDVLKVIDAHPLPNVSRDEHPMARLDALYAQILSKVPGRIMVNTRRILLGLILNPGKEFRRPDDLDYNFLVFCNWLGMTCDDAYAAIRHLLSVLDAPPRNEADRRMLGSFHKSFIDYISDFTRSGFSYDIEHEAYQLGVECTLRILGPIPGGIDVGDTNLFIRGPVSTQVGFLKPGSGTGANIWLSWPFGEETNWPNHMMRLELYRLAVATAVEGIRKGEPAFCTEFCIRLVTSQFDCYIMHHFPYRELQNVVFERSRRHEFIKHGILNQLPVKLFHFNDIAHQTPARLQFRRPTASATNPSDPWNPSCEHYREGSWGEGKHEDWATEFHMDSLPLLSACDFCRKRLEQHFDTLKSRSPDHLVSILFTSTSGSFAEFQFIDPDDGVSEWTYWFVYYIKEEDCRNL
ncbi:hypothetical protein Agabi119p4_9998 [Agaricus bisporus var. burnettii]|uniref:Uncharacterized protein n=1 Tax=Agaricus bisporus var. burnettii TaxID=192524 RepID=A0A8H7C4V9_AGABI|nr:hypothetical protein Agabi119p4_9998 [Agaricus bisporus var. burnettii]